MWSKNVVLCAEHIKPILLRIPYVYILIFLQTFITNYLVMLRNQVEDWVDY
jgi:hypothetical protein